MMDTISVTELAAIKKAICSHFGFSIQSSKLTIHQRNALTLRGHNKYYDLWIQDGLNQHRIFGKLSPHAEKEYLNLRYLIEKTANRGIRIPRPIAIVELANGSLLLQEYLVGYFHILENRRIKYYLPDRIAAIENTGKVVLDKIYHLQKSFSVLYSPLSSADLIGFPNQPKLVGVHYQLDTMHSLSEETKKRLSAKLDVILQNNTPIRRGIIHGDLGMRNIMECKSDMSFIDWDYMQIEGVSLIDPCLFMVMLMMRSIQFLIPWNKVTSLGDRLFQQIKLFEERMVNSENAEFINDGIWFGKCRSLIDTLWWYEKETNNYLKKIMMQRYRQIKYLSYLLDLEAVNGK